MKKEIIFIGLVIISFVLLLQNCTAKIKYTKNEKNYLEEALKGSDTLIVSVKDVEKYWLRAVEFLNKYADLKIQKADTNYIVTNTELPIIYQFERKLLNKNDYKIRVLCLVKAKLVDMGIVKLEDLSKNQKIAMYFLKTGKELPSKRILTR